jgi:hypothetical protein
MSQARGRRAAPGERGVAAVLPAAADGGRPLRWRASSEGDAATLVDERGEVAGAARRRDASLWGVRPYTTLGAGGARPWQRCAMAASALLAAFCTLWYVHCGVDHAMLRYAWAAAPDPPSLLSRYELLVAGTAREVVGQLQQTDTAAFYPPHPEHAVGHVDSAQSDRKKLAQAQALLGQLAGRLHNSAAASVAADATQQAYLDRGPPLSVVFCVVLRERDASRRPEASWRQVAELGAHFSAWRVVVCVSSSASPALRLWLSRWREIEPASRFALVEVPDVDGDDTEGGEPRRWLDRAREHYVLELRRPEYLSLDRVIVADLDTTEGRWPVWDMARSAYTPDDGTFGARCFHVYDKDSSEMVPLDMPARRALTLLPDAGAAGATHAWLAERRAVRVDSCFGGVAVFAAQVFRECDYTRREPEPELSEHAQLSRCIRERGRTVLLDTGVALPLAWSSSLVRGWSLGPLVCSRTLLLAGLPGALRKARLALRGSKRESGGTGWLRVLTHVLVHDSVSVLWSALHSMMWFVLVTCVYERPPPLLARLFCCAGLDAALSSRFTLRREPQKSEVRQSL